MFRFAPILQKLSQLFVCDATYVCAPVSQVWELSNSLTLLIREHLANTQTVHFCVFVSRMSGGMETLQILKMNALVYILKFTPPGAPDRRSVDCA